MFCTKQITPDMYWVGGSDRRLALFENVFPIPRGVSYNSYLINDNKTVLVDTVDKAVSTVFFENVARVLGGKPLDYLIVNHMEPDHCATIGELVLRYPGVKIVGNARTIAMIKQFFTFDIDLRAEVVAEGDTLETGNHTLTFLLAPMVHWPEVMVTYDITTKTLYSADAFGTFGAINGNIFADEVNFEAEWLPDARRYYTNIVGKYGNQVQALLAKAASVEINMICPLHGPVWRNNVSWFIDKYVKWSTYAPEEQAVMIAYASVYGGTENAADIIASKLADAGCCNVVMYDVSATHPSVIVAESFRCSHLVFASTTYNAGIFCNMETALLDLKAHNLQNRVVALVENGSWAPTSGGLMADIFNSMKDINIIANTLTLKSTLKEEQLQGIDLMVAALIDSMRKAKPEVGEQGKVIDPNAMFKLSYGLYVLTARDGNKDNGCIINTVMQVTDNPKRVSIAVNTGNYTRNMILKTGLFSVSVLTEEAPFKVFQHFGFQSGREVNKFENCETENRDGNGLLYIPKYTNAYISCKVVETKELGSHTLFVADVVETKILSDKPSMTYSYYFEHVKPKPIPVGEKKKGWVCKICGYVYEGETLPPDFICPLCKHGAEDFEKL